MALLSVKFDEGYAKQIFESLVDVDEFKAKIVAYKIATGLTKKILAIVDLMVTGILLVEKIAEPLGSGLGADKKKVIVGIMDELVDFGGLLGSIAEMIDGAIFGLLVDILVDKLLNK